ncbi:MAG TPA: DUF5130 family protein [Actinomycetes bacterium]|nr:DUF5130 family protein [Actinomycetes bacterium]
MPAGEPFTARQRDDIDRAVRLGEKQGQMHIKVYVGPLEGDSRQTAQRLHAELGPAAAGSVLVAVDPVARAVEIVTGANLARRLPDRDCALAAMTMTSSFSLGDLAGGIVDGIRTLAEHARAPRTLHLEAH